MGKRTMGARGRRKDARVCMHEAAHLVACCKLALSTPDSVTVVGGRGYDGIVRDLGLMYECHPKLKSEIIRHIRKKSSKEKFLLSIARMREKDGRNVIMALSGYAAEYRRRRLSRADACSELEEARCVADMLGVRFDDIEQSLRLLQVYETNEKKREEWFRDLWMQTYRLVGEWWPEIRKVAAILQERRTLDREGIFEVYELIEGKGI